MISFFVMLTLAVFILAAMIWRYDKYRRECWYMLLFALGLGSFTCPCIGHLNDWLILSSGSDSVLVLSTFAGVNEELAKVLVVALIALVCRNHFDDPMDGIVYGAFVGLGFAIAESSFYIPDTLRVMPDVTHQDLFGQESIRAVLHYLTGGIAAFGIGLARCGVHNWKRVFLPWLGAAMLIHFLWDYACGLTTADDVTGILFQKTAAIGLMIAALILFRFAIVVCGRWSEVAGHKPRSVSQTPPGMKQVKSQ